MSLPHNAVVGFSWNPPAEDAEISRATDLHGAALPADYLEVVRAHNGGHSQGNLSIYDVEDAVQRNLDYEVAEYLPGYFMIGDDGGGQAIVLHLGDRKIYEVDMGVMDAESLEFSANSLTELLELGTSLMERSGS